MAATRKTNGQLMSITTLSLPKEDFKNNLLQRVEIGNELLNREVKTILQLEQNLSDYGKWNDYNSELLKSAFDPPHNEYKRIYDNSTTSVGLGPGGRHWGMRSSNPDAERLKNLKERLRIKVDYLQSLYEKVDLLRCPAEAGQSANFTNQAEVLAGSVGKLNFDHHYFLNLISYAETEKAILELKKILAETSNFEAQKKISNLSSRWFVVKDLKNSGVASFDNVNTEITKINSSITELIGELANPKF